MKEKLISMIGKKLDDLNVFVDDVKLVDSNNEKVLEIVLDREEDFIDLKTVVMATRILNPIVDEMKLDIDSLDVYAKEKGGNYE